jgi:hypothetical protein
MVYGSSTIGYLALLHSKDEPPSARAAAGRGIVAGEQTQAAGGDKAGQSAQYERDI